MSFISILSTDLNFKDFSKRAAKKWLVRSIHTEVLNPLCPLLYGKQTGLLVLTPF